MEILIYNLVFWTVWISLSALPQIIFQRMIDNPSIASKDFFEKNSK